MSASPDLDPTPVPTAPAACSVAASCHLSADQVDDHLIGCLAAEPAAHLATCPLCTRRVAAAAAPFTSFQRVTTAWSERRSATLTVPIHSRQRPLWQRHLGWATACLTVAIGVALTNAGPGWFAFSTPGPQSATLQTAQQDSAPAPHADQISADNHMLQAIDAALDTSAETPAALGLQTASQQRTPPPASLQD
jgi:hypothetical protein